MRAVGVALATYNGERFIEPFLASLREQSYPSVELIVSDDGSKDGTVAKIEHMWPQAQMHRNAGPSGAVGNFNHALSKITQRYAVLADQDDVWLPDKIAKLMSVMEERERAAPGVPIMVFSDLRVVDSELKVIDESFVGGAFNRKNDLRLCDLMINNHVPGCAMLINDALLQRAMPIPQGVMMHDWWLALVAATFGVIAFVDEPLVLYRQHGSNALGAPSKRTLTAKWLDRISAPSNRIKDYRRSAASTCATLAIFGERFDDVMPPSARQLFGDVLHRGAIDRLLTLRGAHTRDNFLKSVALTALMPRKGPSN